MRTHFYLFFSLRGQDKKIRLGSVGSNEPPAKAA